MRQKGFAHLFLLVLLAAGIIVLVFALQGQNFDIREEAAGHKKPTPTSTLCSCSGSRACDNFSTQSKCESNPSCTWACSPTSTPVSQPQPAITSPNGGESWIRGNTYTITWTQDQVTASTGLFLYTRGESGDSYLGAIAYHVSNVVGTNSYSWTIPQLGSSSTTPPEGSNIIVSVAQYDENGNRIVEDKSDSPFTVTSPKPTIITPNGGETWVRGNTYTITWNQSFKATSTGLFLYTRNGSTDTYLGAIEYYVSNNVGTNSYNWTIPPLGGPRTTPPDGDNIIVSIAQYDTNGNRTIEDKSDAPFTVLTQ